MKRGERKNYIPLFSILEYAEENGILEETKLSIVAKEKLLEEYGEETIYQFQIFLRSKRAILGLENQKLAREKRRQEKTEARRQMDLALEEG